MRREFLEDIRKSMSFRSAAAEPTIPVPNEIMDRALLRLASTQLDMKRMGLTEAEIIKEISATVSMWWSDTSPSFKQVEEDRVQAIRARLMMTLTNSSFIVPLSQRRYREPEYNVAKLASQAGLTTYPLNTDTYAKQMAITRSASRIKAEAGKATENDDERLLRFRRGESER